MLQLIDVAVLLHGVLPLLPHFSAAFHPCCVSAMLLNRNGVTTQGCYLVASHCYLFAGLQGCN